MGKPIASVAGGLQSVLLGLGVHRPERVVTNDEICELIDSTDEWIQTRSGIKSRRFSGVDSTPIASKRFLIVPELSSAARMPLPPVTIALAISASWSLFIAVSPDRI